MLAILYTGNRDQGYIYIVILFTLSSKDAYFMPQLWVIIQRILNLEKEL
jgi:hypothetical protein